MNRLTIFGTGHAMTTKCYNTCFTLENDKGLMMVDGGGGNGVLRQLKCAGVHPVDLHEVFVTHRHLDHLMGVMWLVTLLGLAGVTFACVVGFFPPSNLPVGNPALYVALVACGMILFTGAPLVIHACMKHKRDASVPEHE